MPFQNSVIIIISILGITILLFIIIYFRKKKLYLEEKVKMGQQFESEVLRTRIEVQEQTMQIIASDLRDNIGQLLSLTTLTLNSINLEEPEKSEKKLATSLNLINKSTKELRDLTKLLHGEQMVGMGLGRAIEQNLDWLRRIGKYKLNIKNQILDIHISSPKKDLVILRLLQEILHNIIKHAKATHIEISIFIAKETLYLCVKENGAGFNYTEIREQNNGIGFHSINKCIEMLTGKIEVDAKPLKGALIKIAIPYH